ncbi:hypothetical protein AV530_000764 [Patagioenas fasciata monilis]|uniref:Uncharacterized protein n=1 Tax=Patagioenas fasciata monilis TaxID=372326 RepID=A0A1V4KS55_PATFA|nr:hypothetical protein AV530_000764 [Patagioenas fasciata monilis]
MQTFPSIELRVFSKHCAEADGLGCHAQNRGGWPSIPRSAGESRAGELIAENEVNGATLTDGQGTENASLCQESLCTDNRIYNWE